jgi:phage-related holin
MESVKAFFSFIASALLAIINPLFNPTVILAILFAIDVISGIVADKLINKTDFSFKKFFNSVMFLFFYVVIIGVLYLTCYLQQDLEQGALILKTVTYVCAYFYFSNIAKNLHKSYPANRFFSFLYFVLSLDLITKKIPILNKFLEKEKDEQINNP